MIKLNTSDTLAAIGCATGLVSLTLTIIQLWKSKPKLKFEFPKNNCYFEKLPSMDNCLGTHQALVEMTSINKSSSPITIYKIKITSNGEPITWITPRSDKIELIEKINLFNKDMRTTKFYTSSKYSLPKTIEPYGVFEGFIFLPHLYTPTDDVNLKIEVFTTSKTFKTKISIPPYSQRNIECNIV